MYILDNGNIRQCLYIYGEIECIGISCIYNFLENMKIVGCHIGITIYICTHGCVMEYMGYHRMEIVFFRDTILGVHMDISWKYHINYHIIEWSFWDLLIISVDTPPLKKNVANGKNKKSAQQMPVFCGSKLGCFFWLVGFQSPNV